MTKAKFGYIRLLSCYRILLTTCGSTEILFCMIQNSKPLVQCMMPRSVITKLYEKVDTYSAEDWWYFNVLLAGYLTV
jgi:hypothetical protein